jgi:flagellar biosynthesis protein FlhA
MQLPSPIREKLIKGGIVEFGQSNRDVLFAIGVISILGMLFVPLMPTVLDFGLAVSLSFSFLILMVTLWISTPLEFNSFPTLLLVVTMLRLSLNVSSTRLILSEGHTGAGAAGQVIDGFSRFIVGGDFVIGIVIFSILIIINFVVITKGSTRIAEVAARFSLDAMPGKQMAIDADFGAGIISDEEAQNRRNLLSEESAFFGAMDGASKFVRGDAVAGLIITFINIIGGILIGVTSHGLSISEAANNYTILTIGDGLVTQIPALTVSLSAGILVTKGGTKGAANEAVLLQLASFPKALYMAGSLVFLVGLLPGFPVVIFSGLAASLAGLGYLMQAYTASADESDSILPGDEASKPTENAVRDQLKLDEMRLDLGISLVPLIASIDASLPGKVSSLRSLFIREYGFVLPSVRIKDNPRLSSANYSILIQGVEAAQGEIHPNSMMVIEPNEDEISLSGLRTKEPTFGLNAVWVDTAQAVEAELRGLTVVDPESVITTHLTEIIKEHMPDLLTFASTQELVDGLDKGYQKLIADMSVTSPIVLVQHVLQGLLSERVSIRNLPKIVEVIAEASTSTSSVKMIIEHVRGKLSKQICQGLIDDSGYLAVIVLDQKWEHELNNSISKNGEETNFIMSPKRVQEFVLAVRQVISKFSAGDDWPALLVSPDVRPFVRSMLERVSPMTQVISHNEIHRKVSIRTSASVLQ